MLTSRQKKELWDFGRNSNVAIMHPTDLENYEYTATEREMYHSEISFLISTMFSTQSDGLIQMKKTKELTANVIS